MVNFIGDRGGIDNMGEKIKNISETSIRNNRVYIELNESQNDLNSYDIHIEAPMFRFAMNDSEYMKFASAVLEARKKMVYTKNIDS